MTHTIDTTFATQVGPRFILLALSSMGLLCLPQVGCAPSQSAQEVAAARVDPTGEFEWGMERLERALRDFRPSGVGGVKVTDRKVSHELFPPDKEHPNYRARVTIITETSFLHDKHQVGKQEEDKPKPEEKSEIKDPLANPDDELSKLIDIPGVGPYEASAVPVEIETRSLESKSVFDMIYLDGHWQLTQKPEKKHEQLWFEYAFD